MFTSIRHKIVKVVLATAVAALLIAAPTAPAALADGQCSVPPTQCTG